MGYSLLKAPRSAQRHLDQKYLSFELAGNTAQHATEAFCIGARWMTSMAQTISDFIQNLNCVFDHRSKVIVIDS
jgi:hypothetical protein